MDRGPGRRAAQTAQVGRQHDEAVPYRGGDDDQVRQRNRLLIGLGLKASRHGAPFRQRRPEIRQDRRDQSGDLISSRETQFARARSPDSGFAVVVKEQSLVEIGFVLPNSRRWSVPEDRKLIKPELRQETGAMRASRTKRKRAPGNFFSGKANAFI
jgi:hypothetical protein